MARRGRYFCRCVWNSCRSDWCRWLRRRTGALIVGDRTGEGVGVTVDESRNHNGATHSEGRAGVIERRGPGRIGVRIAKRGVSNRHRL